MGPLDSLSASHEGMQPMGPARMDRDEAHHHWCAARYLYRSICRHRLAGFFFSLSPKLLSTSFVIHLIKDHGLLPTICGYPLHCAHLSPVQLCI